MKLANHLTLRLSLLFMLILLIWSVIYFFKQMNEIYDGIDEGLNNLKQELILEANKIPDFMDNMAKYDPLNLFIEKISYEEAIGMKEVYSNTFVYFESEQEKEEVRMLTTAFLCTQDNEYYRIKIFTSTVESDDMIENMLYLLMTLWVALSLFLIIATKRIINKSSKPFYTLLSQLKHFKLNERQMPDLPTTSISEYSDLIESVKELLEKNINAYAEQRHFIENASHELQTPIAIAIGKLELMMNDDSLSQQQVEDINIVINSLGRTKRLNNTLLLLSKIKNKQFTRNELIDFTQVFDEVLEDFEALANYKEITINTEKRGIPQINMNRDLAFIMVNNLVKNAIAHNKTGGHIDIVFDNKTITIANSGEPLPPDNTDIFSRYVSYSGSKQSSGLGLSIVKTIVEQYNIQINHNYSNGIHTITLKFN